MARGKKKIIFYTITLLTPLFFLGFIELALRIFQVGQDAPPLFMTNPTNRWENIMNPAVGQRYFPEKEFATTGSYDTFLKEKSDSTIRIFVQGASSSAGFPFRAASFPRLLEQKLQYFYPHYAVEVVNTSLVATNSYTVRDMVPEIVEQEPDMVIIYSGHNEYYGALGVGSSQSLGKYPEVTNFYLRMKNLRLIQLLKSILIRTSSRAQRDSDETLMSKMVKDKSISYDSDIENLGVRQYKSNIGKALEAYNKAGIPVFLSSLISNVKDFPPFESDSGVYSAEKAFEMGRKYIMGGDTAAAKVSLLAAKDYDLIKFRAPSKIENVIPELAKAYGVHLLDMKAAFESVYPIVGQELLIEHVHANLDGQKLWAETAFNATKELLAQQDIKPVETTIPFEYAIAETDSIYAYKLVESMMSKWPFVSIQDEEKQRDNVILAQITSGQITFDKLLLQAYYDQLNRNPSKAWQTAHILWQEYGNVTHRLLEAEALRTIGNYGKAELILDRFPSDKKDHRYFEVRMYNQLSQGHFQEALGYAEMYLQEQNDFHTEKVKESIQFVLDHPELSHDSRENILRSPDDYVALLEAYLFMNQQDYFDQLVNKLENLIPNHPKLMQLRQQGRL